MCLSSLVSINVVYIAAQLHSRNDHVGNAVVKTVTCCLECVVWCDCDTVTTRTVNNC